MGESGTDAHKPTLSVVPTAGSAPGSGSAERSSTLDARSAAVADRLEKQNRRQARRIVLSASARLIHSRVSGRRGSVSDGDDGRAWLLDKLDAMDRTKAQICYVAARSLGARRIVEAGTGFGHSTIYLAAAVRDNVAAEPDAIPNGHHPPTVIGTEFETAKAEAAQRNLNEAGLGRYATVLRGDLGETLPTITGPVDMMVLDVWIDQALPALEATFEALRPGALVVANNVIAAADQYAEYLDRVRDPQGPFRSSTLPMRGGMEFSVRR